MDMDHLMSEQGMRAYTDGQRDSLMDWAGEVRQITQIVQARLANTHIEGDKSAGEARKRSRKVSRRMARVARLLEKSAAETEAINAVYKREVIDLPARRANAAVEGSSSWRQRFGIADSPIREQVTNSLQESVHALNGTQQTGNQQATTIPAMPVQPAYLPPQPYHQAGPGAGTVQDFAGLGDIFKAAGQ